MRVVMVSTMTGGETAMAKMAGELQKRGHEALFLVANLPTESRLRRAGFPVYNPNREMAQTQPPGRAEAEALFARYQIEFDKIAFAQKARFGNGEDYARKLAYGYVTHCEPYLARHSPDLLVIFDYMPLDLIAWRLAARRGIPVLYTNGGSVIAGHHWWGSPDFFDWVQAEYLEKPLSPAQAAEVHAYMAAVQGEQPFIGAEFLARRTLSNRLTNLATYFWEYVQDRPYNRSNYSFAGYVRTHTEFYALLPFKVRFYSPVEPGEKFFFFPLHVKDDFSLTYYAIDMWQQDAIVEQVARAVPPGYKLYVKEHRAPLWPVPVSWVRNMAQCPNVRLIHPLTNAHELIRRCAGVVTIRSDVGWEALNYYKPVIVFKRPFYAGRGVTIDTPDLGRLGESVDRALRGDFPDREKVDRLVYAVLQSVYPTTPFPTIADPTPVVDGMLAEYRRRTGH
jgi:hypothetical protein